MKRADDPREIAKSKNETLYCSFCGQSQHEVKQLIASNQSASPVFICDGCIGHCNDIILDTRIAKQVRAILENEHD